MPYKITTRPCSHCGQPFSNRKPEQRYCSCACRDEARRVAIAALPVQHCAYPDCDRLAYSKGMCQKHYTRAKKHGDPSVVTPYGVYPRPPVAQRFWALVDRSGGPDACWPWLASQKGNGYGQFVFDGSNTTAHRVAYILTHGPIPAGLEVDHVKTRGCTLRHCCNPAHLEAVTHLENVLRSNGPSAMHAQQTHCKNGHQFDEANTYVWRGSRHCRVCRGARPRRVA